MICFDNKPGEGTMNVRCASMLFLGAVLAAPAAAPAQGYPAKSVRYVLPFAAGSAVDVLARYYAQRMTESWRQQVVVDNRTGANGIIGTELAAHAPADGYTIYLGNVATLAINPNLYPKLPYDVLRDFAPISLTAEINNCLAVHPSLPVKSVKELIAFAKARPGQLNYASGGVGSAQHIPMEMLKTMTGINIVHIAYKGLTPAFNDVVAGQVPMMIPGLVTALPYRKDGRLRILALTGAKRTSAAPDIPTIGEAGVPGYDFDSWTGFLAPAGTPPEIISRLNAEVVRITRLPDTRERLSASGFQLVGSTPQEFGDYIKVNIARIGKVVREAGIKAE
jgi:tripartite-type tricarboxylate transporter receptor subunit TctC